MLHESLAERARQLGAVAIITDSWLTATGYYYKLGYRVPGAVFPIRSRNSGFSARSSSAIMILRMPYIAVVAAAPARGRDR